MMQNIQNLLRSQNARIYYWCLGLTLLWRAGLEVLNQTLVPNMVSGPGTQDPNALKPGMTGLLRWVNSWDAAWYNDIARHGYVIVHNFQGYESVAFFPLFPYLVRGLAAVTHIPFQLIGLVINVCFTSLIAFLLYKLTCILAVENGIKSPQRLGQLAAIFLLVNPSAFFFAAFYADAVLVLLVLASIYFAFKDRYILAALLGGLATGAKSIGVVALPVLFLIYLSRSKVDIVQTIRKGWLTLAAMCALSVSGIVAYMFYLLVRFGHPLAFVEVEKYWSRNISGFFLSNIWGIWYEKLFDPYYFRPMSNYLYDLFLMFVPVAVVAFSAYILVRHRLQYAWLAALCVLTVLIPMSTGTLLSINRYALLLVPAISYVMVHIYNRSAFSRASVLIAGYASAVVMIVFVLTFLSYRFAG